MLQRDQRRRYGGLVPARERPSSGTLPSESEELSESEAESSSDRFRFDSAVEEKDNAVMPTCAVTAHERKRLQTTDERTAVPALAQRLRGKPTIAGSLLQRPHRHGVCAGFGSHGTVLIVVTRVGFAGGPRGRHAVAVRVQGSSPPRRLNANSTRQNTLRNLSLHHEFHHQAAATVCRVALRTGRGHRTLDTMLAPHCLPDALPELAHAG